MKICSIVVLYEPEKKELSNILDYYDEVDKVYILDNSIMSKEENIKKALLIHHKDVDKKMKYIYFGGNIGLCKALNHGMRIAAQEGFEWSLLMDADSTFNTNVVSAYQNYVEKNDCSDVGVLAPVHLFDRSLERPFKGYKDVTWAMTSGCLYNISVFEKNHGFKDELFVDGLDIDYCYRIRRGGYRIVEIANARINHFPGKTQTRSFLGLKIRYGIAPPSRYYMQARALIWLMLEYGSINDTLRYGVKWVKVILLFENKGDYIKQLIRGTKDGISLWKEEHR